MQREFTGRDLMKVMVIGFGIVVAVNLFMATLATRGFGGVIVENSYVASQNFNGWLREAESGEELGWDAKLSRSEDGYLLVRLDDTPQETAVTALLRRPLGPEERNKIAFTAQADGSLRSTQAVPVGRWIVRLTLSSGSQSWAREVALQ